MFYFYESSLSNWVFWKKILEFYLFIHIVLRHSLVSAAIAIFIGKEWE